MNGIIQATSGTYRSRVDGTLVLTVEISPLHRTSALELFGMPGQAMALAALTQEASQKAAQDTTIAATSQKVEAVGADKPKRGLLSQWASMRCADLLFVEFLRPIYDKYMGGDGSGWGDVTADNDFGGDSELWARHVILVLCEIESRSELDTNKAAAALFNNLIRLPYCEYSSNVENPLTLR